MPAPSLEECSWPMITARPAEKHLQKAIQIFGGLNHPLKVCLCCLCREHGGQPPEAPQFSANREKTNVHHRLLGNMPGCSAHSRRNKRMNQLEFKGYLTILLSSPFWCESFLVGHFHSLPKCFFCWGGEGSILIRTGPQPNTSSMTLAGLEQRQFCEF